MSAQEMVNKGRKNLFGAHPDGTTRDDQTEINTRLQDTGPFYNPKWEDYRHELCRINENFLDWLASAHIVSREQIAEFKRMDYIPFYRFSEDLEDGNIDFLFPKAGGKTIGKIHMLKGSAKKRLGDPMVNLVSSYRFLMHQGLKNLARKRTLAIAMDAGFLCVYYHYSETSIL